MDLGGLLRSRTVRQVALVLAYVLASGAVLGLLLLTTAAPEHRAALRAAFSAAAVPLGVLTVLALLGLAVLLLRGLGSVPAAVRRLAADVRVVVGANPDHRLDASGPAELGELAVAVNELADRRAAAEGDVTRQVAAARAEVEQERNRLAAVMSDLTVAVLVCSPGGRVLLYNSAARALLADDPALGLGRSVFGLVDRALVTHALDRVADGQVASHVSTVLRDGRLLQVRLSPVTAADPDGAGFVLVLEDTSHLQAQRRRDAALRSLTESTRAAAAGIRAAVETVLDYPDMAAQERAQFLAILSEESQRLGAQVEGWAAEATGLTGDWVLTDMRGDDLLTVLARALERRPGLSVSVDDGGPAVWLRVDSHALSLAVEQLAQRLRSTERVEQVALSLAAASGRHARLDLAWTGAPLDADALRAWLDEPLSGGGAASVREVVERHDAEAWSSPSAERTARLHLLMPVTDAALRGPAVSTAAGADSWPDYDFSLFDLPEASLEDQDRRLSDLSYAVFDTETTGFSPDRGDEIVSIGAVRVVNGRVRRQEVFDRLVDPRRSVPAASSAVHGITTEMVRGQPELEQVLPHFARFVEDAVLVGHNVGFDLAFLRAREERTGVRLTSPVLDTLLLDAAVHPDHDGHSLEAIAGRLGVDVTGRHTALGDALVTADVFVRLLALLQARGISTLGEALAASRATHQAKLEGTLYGR